VLILKGLLVNIILAVLRWEKKNADEMVGKGVGGATVYKSYDTRVGTGCQGESEARDAERTGLPQRHRGHRGNELLEL